VIIPWFGRDAAVRSPLAKEPTGAYRHADRRPVLGRKLKGTSQRELRDLGLIVEDGERTDESSPTLAT
jgi:hypothetical protein